MSIEVEVSEYIDVTCNDCGHELTGTFSNGTLYVDACSHCCADQYNEGHSAGEAAGEETGNEEGYERGYAAATRDYEEGYQRGYDAATQEHEENL